jgi:cytochrome oxidase Cu insertion factor (SCO1/SenC/PrrC family)
MAIKKNAGRNRIVAILILLLPASLLVFLSTRGCSHKFEELPDYGIASDYHFIDGRGKSFSSKDFKDKIVVITTLQLTCPDSCAISMWHVDQAIYQHIRKNKKKLKQVKIISFVTDGKGNPITDLSMLTESMKDNVEGFDPDIWFLASGNPRSVFDFKFNDQSLLQKGSNYFGGEAFTELMLLLDKQNHLRMVNRGNAEGTIRRMYQHIALLQKQYDKAMKAKMMKSKSYSNSQ